MKVLLNGEMSKLFLLVICLLVILGNSEAQEVSWIGHLEEKDGLAERVVERITRDERGYFYLFMDKKVQKFDGRTFKEIDLPSSFLKDNTDLQNICFFEDGSSLIQFDNSFESSYMVRNDQLVPVYQDVDFEHTNNVDSVFLSGNERGMFFLVPNEGEYDVYDFFTQKRVLKQISIHQIPHKSFLENNSLITESRDGIVEIYDKNGGNKIQRKGRLIYQETKLLLIDDHSINKWDGEKFVQLKLFDFNGFECLWVKSDKNNNILIAHYENLAKINNLHLFNKNGELVSYNKILNTTKNIRDVYADDFTVQIMAATFNSLYVFALKNDGISNFYSMNRSSISEFGFVISTVVYNPSNGLTYFTTESEDLLSIDSNQSIINENNSSHYVNTNSMVMSRDTQNLVSTSYSFNGTGAITVFNIENKKSKKFGIDFVPLSTFEINENEFLIVGSKNKKDFVRDRGRGQSISFNIEKESFTEFILPQEILKSQLRNGLLIPETRQLWIGTTEGLYCMDENRNIIQAYTNKSSNTSFRISHDHIRMIKKYGNNLFVGTRYDGLYVIDLTSLKIVVHKNTINGLTDNAIISSEMDAQGNFWLGSFRGVSVLDSDYNVIARFYHKDGISNPEFNTLASAITESGSLYFGTINGLTQFEPQKCLSFDQDLKVDIERMVIYRSGTTREVFIQSDVIELSGQDDSVRLIYNTPDYFQHHYISHQNLIDLNVSKDINFIHSNNTLNFTELKVGEYHLGLKSSQDSTFKTYTLIVKRDYKPWLIWGGLLFGISCFLFYIRFLSKNNKEEMEKEKNLHNRQIAELELSALRSQMNPHFIFNALGSIQYFINTNDIVKADDYLAKFAMLMRFILESSKSRYILLEDELKLLELYSSLEHIRFEEKFTYSIEVDPTIDTHSFEIPSMIIQPFVENAINHGLFNLENKMGYLSIVFQGISEDHIVCVIKDNGIGMEASKKIKNIKPHKSRGMQIVNERIQALKMNKDFNIAITITDLIDSESGTEVNVSIKRL